MKIVIKKIPTAAKIFYLVGFVILGSCLLIYFRFPNWLPIVVLQQTFIAGAIIVAIGSVINTIYQFGKHRHPDQD